VLSWNRKELPELEDDLVYSLTGWKEGARRKWASGVRDCPADQGRSLWRRCEEMGRERKNPDRNVHLSWTKEA
jgi:hypothetical protein